MDIVSIIVLWGLLAGLAIGLSLVFFAPAELRLATESQFLRFGSGGTLLMLAWSLVSADRAAAQVEIGIGVAVFAPLVAGVVLSIARKVKTGV